MMFGANGRLTRAAAATWVYLSLFVACGHVEGPNVDDDHQASCELDISCPEGSDGGAGSDGSGNQSPLDARAADTGMASPDSVAPGVVSISPRDRATGVLADAVITIKFTEPMDREKTEAAYRSDDLPPNQVTFAWDEGGTLMTIKPNAKLPYATGSSTSVVARTFRFLISGDAEDRAGNKLGSAVSSTFQTARLITTDLPFAPSLSGHVDNDGDVYPEIYVGSEFGYSLRGFVTFDLVSLENAIRVEKAELSLNQSYVYGMPYQRLGGQINVDHVTFSQTDLALYSKAPLRAVGVWSNSAAEGWKKLTVTSNVVDDWEKRAARGNRSQYRLAFPKAISTMTADDTVVIFVPGDEPPRLTVTAVMP